MNGCKLDPRLDLRRLSLEGFEWGYVGSGPYQLALAILADHYDSPQTALETYRTFCETTVAALPPDGWELDSNQVDNAVAGVVELDMTLAELLDKARGIRP